MNVPNLHRWLKMLGEHGMCLLTGVSCTLEAGFEVRLQLSTPLDRNNVNQLKDHKKDHTILARDLLWRSKLFHTHSTPFWMCVVWDCSSHRPVK